MFENVCLKVHAVEEDRFGLRHLLAASQEEHHIRCAQVLETDHR